MIFPTLVVSGTSPAHWQGQLRQLPQAANRQESQPTCIHPLVFISLPHLPPWILNPLARHSPFFFLFECRGWRSGGCHTTRWGRGAFGTLPKEAGGPSSKGSNSEHRVASKGAPPHFPPELCMRTAGRDMVLHVQPAVLESAEMVSGRALCILPGGSFKCEGADPCRLPGLASHNILRRCPPKANGSWAKYQSTGTSVCPCQ